MIIVSKKVKQYEENILIVTVTIFGGATIFLNQYVNESCSHKGVYVLYPFDNSENADKFNLIDYRHQEQKQVVAKNFESLNKIIEELNIKSIFVNNLVLFDLQFIMNWILQTRLPFDFFIHDYFCVCANQFLDCQVKYCAENETHPNCRKYFKRFGMPNVNIQTYRKAFITFLSRARKIYTPTSYTAGIVKQFYPQLEIEPKPHSILIPMQRTFKKRFAEREKLRITFLGDLIRHKGQAYFLLGNEFIRRENLPIEFVHLGTYHNEIVAGTKEGVIFAGKYDNKEVSKLLMKYETAIVAIMSNVPETYCYTASEAILSGYPLLSLNVGSHAARIQRNDCGWTMPINSPSSGLEELKAFFRFIVTPEGRQQILLKAANTKNFKNGSE